MLNYLPAVRRYTYTLKWMQMLVPKTPTTKGQNLFSSVWLRYSSPYIVVSRDARPFCNPGSPRELEALLIDDNRKPISRGTPDLARIRGLGKYQKNLDNKCRFFCFEKHTQ